MKSLLRLLGTRWFLTLLGTSALGLLVWVLGPLIGFAGREPLASPGSRGLVIGILFGLWALAHLVAALRTRRLNRHLLDQLAARPAPEPDAAKVASEEELRTLRERFEAERQLINLHIERKHIEYRAAARVGLLGALLENRLNHGS